MAGRRLVVAVSALALTAACTSAPGSSETPGAGRPPAGPGRPSAAEATPACPRPQRGTLTRLDGLGVVRWHRDLKVDGEPAALAPAQDDALVFSTAGKSVTAYDKDTGEQRWQVPTTPEGARQLLRLPGLLVVLQWALDGHGALVEGLDPATGSRRWRVTAEQLPPGALMVIGDTSPLSDDGTAPASGLVWRNQDGSLTALDVDSGRLRWHVPGGPGGLDAAVLVGGGLVVRGIGDRTQAYAAATGSPVWTVAGLAGSNENQVLTSADDPATVAAGDIVVVTERGPDDAPHRQAGVRLGTGQVLWRRTRPAEQNLFPVVSTPAGLVGVGSFPANAIELVDPVTGGTRWQQPAQGQPSDDGPVVLDGIVVQQEGKGGAPVSLVARRLTDGTPVWRAPYAVGDRLQRLAGGGVLVVGDRAVALDAAGRQRWRVDFDPGHTLDRVYVAEPVAVPDGGALLQGVGGGCSHDDGAGIDLPVSPSPAAR